MKDFTKLKKSLTANGYEVSCFENKEDAAKYLNEQIDGATVGFGGSVTLQEMGLFDSLSTHNTVWWHWRLPEGMSVPEEHAKAAAADVYLASVNGIAETGEIINIAGSGNRVASTMFGHKKVYLIVGENKIAEDYEKALWRARNIAGPLNAQRLNRKTPCALKADRCYDCSSPDRICKALLVFWKKPNAVSIEVVLVGEKLGY